MDTQEILDSLGKIADELAKILAAVKQEQETKKAMGQTHDLGDSRGT